MSEVIDKPNAHQDIEMQFDRLTQILDDLYNCAESNLGQRHSVTYRAFKATLYLHALKCDIKAEKKDG